MAETFLIAIGGSSAGLSPNELSRLKAGGGRFRLWCLSELRLKLVADVHSVWPLFVRQLSTSRIGDSLVNDVTSAVEWPVPGSAKFKVFGAIDRHSCGSVRDRHHQDTYRRLHNLIALSGWLVEHAVGVVSFCMACWR